MSALKLHGELDAVWGVPRGWRGVLTSVNHSDLGIRFMVAAGVYFAIGGVLAMMIRAQLATPRSAFIGPEIYNQVFTMHGSLMMFMFAIPFFEGLAMYLLPKLLGSRDLAFPRLSAFGWWCYLFGGSILLVAMAVGLAPDGGWFMYTPLASKTYTPGINADVWLLGITFVEISAVCASIEITVSVLKLRAPGMSLGRMPIFAWYILVTALMMVVGFPPLILASTLLEIERAFGWPFFDPQRGGNPLLWQHLFWLFGHPEVYIIFLPAAGVVSTVLPVMVRHTLLGYGWIVGSILVLGFFSFGLWVHHMFATGIPHLALALFSAASALVAVPTVVQLFAWLATMWAGRPQMRLPMLYIAGFFFNFLLGGLTGVMLAIVPFNWQVHDTAFVTAHLHYVLIGGFIFPMLAGVYYWLPRFTARRSHPLLGQLGFWLIFVGFNVTFLVMHLTGLLGMPRRIYTYEPGLGWEWPNLISSIGSFVMTFGFAVVLIDGVLAIVFGRRSSRNPWRASTLEWALPMPAPSYNLASLPHVESREPLDRYHKLAQSLAMGEGYLGRTRDGLRETTGVEVVSGRVSEIVILPGNSWLPIATAAATGSFFLALLLGYYWLAPIALLGVASLLWRWAAPLGARADLGPIDIGRGASVLPHHEAAEAPGWWGSVFALVTNATFFSSMLFGYAFLATVGPGWPPPVMVQPSLLAGGVVFGAVTLAFLAEGFAFRRMLAGDMGSAGTGLVVAIAALLICMLGLLAFGWLGLPSPRDHAYGAVTWVMLIYGALHGFIALVVLAFVRRRIAAGYVSPARMLEPRVARLWLRYGLAAMLIVLAAIALPGAASWRW
ncbi:cytochrome c oxidase subunit I [Bosea sp. (in: a-proteobacteria)]|uniref:cytochrome c oxidase subunit I n=1 Tax=Bosea sp. (in: a-proteobacteria) TaxID=1871050 RepID=UPI0027328228|nr:cytochrome c oxidase subunit I [Bosea sp. (in: a-proteobacteria)]MDP3411191.1 cytochrome c oxidase subunit I [Bosea sp. (in: a-proteobacteria)]